MTLATLVTLFGPTLFGHWAVVSASCATGFAVAPDRLTLFTPMGFEDKKLPPQVFEAETERADGTFSISYEGHDGEPETMRFTVQGDNLVDRNGYEYRRCGADTDRIG